MGFPKRHHRPRQVGARLRASTGGPKISSVEPGARPRCSVLRERKREVLLSNLCDSSSPLWSMLGAARRWVDLSGGQPLAVHQPAGQAWGEPTRWAAFNGPEERHRHHLDRMKRPSEMDSKEQVKEHMFALLFHTAPVFDLRDFFGASPGGLVANRSS
jgi:hypothetical protein